MTGSNRYRAGKAGGPPALVALGVAISYVFLVPLTADAQTSGEGHAVYAAGSYSNRYASGGIAGIAAGGDVLFSGKFGGGGEIGWLGLGPNISLDGVVHFRNREAQRVVPFILAGYTHSTGEYLGYDGPNVGGGINYWIRPRTALRGEFRDVVQRQPGWREHYRLIRFGIAFR